MPQRFRPSGRNSSWGDDYLELGMPQNHFLRQLRDLPDWEGLTQELADCYKGGAEYGPLPYHPAVPFKMLLLPYSYNLSERQTEEWANENMPARYFPGLAAHQSAPDHSTLTLFKERLLRRRGPQAFAKLFQQVVRLAQARLGAQGTALAARCVGASERALKMAVSYAISWLFGARRLLGLVDAGCASGAELDLRTRLSSPLIAGRELKAPFLAP